MVLERSPYATRMDPSRRSRPRSGVRALFDPDSADGQATNAATEEMIAAHASREELAAAHKARIESHLKSGDIEGAFDYIQTIESDELRNRAFVDFVSRWSMDDPLEAGNWVRDTYGEPFSEEALKSVMRNWAQVSGEDAANWAAALTDSQMRLQGLLWGFSVWAESSDYVSAADWIFQQPKDAAFDVPRSMVAQKMFTVEPSSGVEWAATIPNEEQRGEILWDFYQQWLERDRQAAEASLTQNSLINKGTKRRLLAGEFRD